MKVDMHFHSTNSDWLSTMDELVKLAQEKQMDFVALTDHDKLSHWFREKLDEVWIKSCHSVEISAKNSGHNKSLHLTMYAREISDDINRKIYWILEGRMFMIKTQVEHLNNLWFKLDIDRLIFWWNK
jgi:predicted metal-dependent phosphoesterase TrpH